MPSPASMSTLRFMLTEGAPVADERVEEHVDAKREAGLGERLDRLVLDVVGPVVAPPPCSGFRP